MISIQNVSKSYQGGTLVLEDINIEVKKNEFVVLLGESGSGKTTLLKMLNKLIGMTKGKILINGEDINSINTVKLRRDMGYVVQQTGLFPHMTVKENIELVSIIKDEKQEEYEQKTIEVMKMVGLDPDVFMPRYPHELSGGQAQRVGVARAYATNPDIILMDEPFSALDPITRNELQNELIKLQQNTPKTIIFVTHDIAEAIKLADRIVLLNKGRIEQIGTPRELLLNPKTEYVSKFLGEKRVWKAPWLLKCKDVMTDGLTTINVDAKVEEAWETMKDDTVQAIIVVNEKGQAVGKLTEKIMMRNSTSDTIDGMMKKKFDYIHEDMPLHEAVSLMNTKDILYLPVVDEEMHLKGMLTMPNLLSLFDDNVLSEQR